jgi:cytochrome c553
MSDAQADRPVRRGRRLVVIIAVSVLLGVALCGAGAYGIGRALGIIQIGTSVDACHEDARTVAELRTLPVLSQAPAGAHLGELRERLACGRPAGRGSLEREISSTAPAKDVSAFYAKLAAADGWDAARAGDNIFAAHKPDGHRCRWNLVVRSIAEGTYRVQVTYVPRDLSDTCA